MPPQAHCANDGDSGFQQILNHTLVREIEPDWFDYKAVRWHRRASLETGQSEAIFEYVPGGIGEGAVIDARARSLRVSAC